MIYRISLVVYMQSQSPAQAQLLHEQISVQVACVLPKESFLWLYFIEPYATLRSVSASEGSCQFHATVVVATVGLRYPRC
jgi:hypothetical protein